MHEDVIERLDRLRGVHGLTVSHGAQPSFHFR